MNKTAIIALSAASVITFTGLALYASRDPLEVAFKYNITTSTDFRLPEFIPVQGLAAKQLRGIEKHVCVGVGREDWVPQKVAFAYLDPKETVSDPLWPGAGGLPLPVILFLWRRASHDYLVHQLSVAAAAADCPPRPRHYRCCCCC